MLNGWKISFSTGIPSLSAELSVVPARLPPVLPVQCASRRQLTRCGRRRVPDDKKPAGKLRNGGNTAESGDACTGALTHRIASGGKNVAGVRQLKANPRGSYALKKLCNSTFLWAYSKLYENIFFRRMKIKIFPRRKGWSFKTGVPLGEHFSNKVWQCRGCLRTLFLSSLCVI